MPISHKQSNQAEESEILIQRGNYERYWRDRWVLSRKLISKDGTFSTRGEDYGHKLSDMDLFILQDFRKYAWIYLKSSYILSKLLINFQIAFAKNLILGDKHHE